MSTYRYVAYMVMDYLKLASDDSYYTPDHVMFLLNKYRAFVLKSKYEAAGSNPSDQNYQSIMLNLEKVNRIDGISCGGFYLRSTEKVPDKLSIGTCSVYTGDYLSEGLSWTSPERFRFVGSNKWLKHITYVTKGEDGHLYLKSCDPQLYYLEKAGIRGIFSDPQEAAALSGKEGATCEPLDVEFPLEDNLLPLVMQYVVKELVGGIYKPKDDINNASDDLSDLAQFIRSYTKSPIRKQLEA